MTLITFIEALVAAVILTLIGWVWKKGLGVLNRMFGTVWVYGKWKTRIDRGDQKGWQDHEEVRLHQFINHVWGTSTVTVGKRRTYRLRGEVCGQMLCLVYRQNDKSGFDSGAIILEVEPEGEKLLGYEVGYDRVLKKISPRQYEWTRV